MPFIQNSPSPTRHSIDPLLDLGYEEEDATLIGRLAAASATRLLVMVIRSLDDPWISLPFAHFLTNGWGKEFALQPFKLSIEHVRRYPTLRLQAGCTDSDPAVSHAPQQLSSIFPRSGMHAQISCIF